MIGINPDAHDHEPEPMQIDLADDVNDNNADVVVMDHVDVAVVVALEEDDNFQVENPTLDLDSYANSYSGTAKLFRLIHIADHCPSLRLEALKMAISHVSKTMNVAMYQQLHKKIRENYVAHPHLPDVAGGGASAASSGSADLPQIDPQWVEQMTKKAAIMLDKLDTDLKNYKSNSIKESIRRGYDDLGEYYLECGELMSALKSFTRSRDYCTSAKHVISMCMNVIKVSTYLQNWSHVANFVMKAENTPDPADEKSQSGSKDSSQTISKIRCAAGLAELATKKYKAAAVYFLQVNFDHCDFTDLVSPNNIAVYAGLCALATFERKDLQDKIISSSSFKLFLELEPPMRDVLLSFYESKYAKCLQLLDEMRDNLLLDIYLAPHVRSLYAQIRSRGMVQYFTPFASADMNRMSQCFNTSVPQLENELMNLILSGQIQARIDSHNKILFVKSVDERCHTYEKSLQIGQEYERRTKFMILRAAMLNAHIQVKNPIQDAQDGHCNNYRAGGHHRSNLSVE